MTESEVNIIMKEVSFEQLLEQFIDGVEKTMNIDYAKASSVRRNNRGVDQYRKAAKDIDELYPERLDEFAQLLNAPSLKIRICCAVCLAGLTRCRRETYDKAIFTVEEYVKSDECTEKLGFGVWLSEHRK